MLNSQDLLTKDVEQLKQTVKKRRAEVEVEKEREKESKREKREERNPGTNSRRFARRGNVEAFNLKPIALNPPQWSDTAAASCCVHTLYTSRDMCWC